MQATNKPQSLNVFIHDDTESKGLPSFGQRQFKNLATKSRYILLVLVLVSRSCFFFDKYIYSGRLYMACEYIYIYIYIYYICTDEYDRCSVTATVSRQSVGRKVTHDRKISVVKLYLYSRVLEVGDCVPPSSTSYVSVYIYIYVLELSSFLIVVISMSQA
jgi:hypothetical protein